MTNLLTPNKQKTIRLRRRNAQESLSDNRQTTPRMYYSGMFCGSPYKLNKKDVVMEAFDFDGTLAELFEPYDPRKAGPPLGQGDPKSAFEKAKRLVKQGKKVVILTARLNSKVHTPEQIKYTRKLLSAWTKKFFGKALPCTSEKHHMMTVMYDDRAVAVDPKTGRIK